MAQNLLLERLDKLERQNRLWKAIGSSTLFLTISAAIIAIIGVIGDSIPRTIPIEGLFRFLEHSFSTIFTLVLALAGVALMLRVASAGRPRRSKASQELRREIAVQAIEKLKKARELLKEGDHNLDMAVQLRDEAVKQDLPTVNIIIKGESQRSLLVDVDRRIEAARSRTFVREKQNRREEERRLEARLRETDGRVLSNGSGWKQKNSGKPANERSKKIHQRLKEDLLYSMRQSALQAESEVVRTLRSHVLSAKQRERRVALVWMAVLFLTAGISLWLIGTITGGQAFNQSFSFLH